METRTKVATSNAKEINNATEVAGDKLNKIEKKEMSKEKYKTIDELGELGKDLGLNLLLLKLILMVKM